LTFISLFERLCPLRRTPAAPYSRCAVLAHLPNLKRAATLRSTCVIKRNIISFVSSIAT